jgi:hypothetical protein
MALFLLLLKSKDNSSVNILPRIPIASYYAFFARRELSERMMWMSCVHVYPSSACLVSEVRSVIMFRLNFDFGGLLYTLLMQLTISSSLCIQTSSEAHPAPYPMSTGVLSGVKAWPEREADRSLPSSVKVVNE